MYESVIKALEKQWAETYAKIPKEIRDELKSIESSIQFLKSKSEKGERI